MSTSENKVWTKEEQKAHRAELCAALRSGKYKQSAGALHTTDGGFCCLGVAEDLRGVEWREDVFELSGIFVFGEGEAIHTAGLSRDGMAYYGFAKPLGQYKPDNGNETALAYKNDSGVSFEEIATIIENEPEALFVD